MIVGPTHSSITITPCPSFLSLLPFLLPMCLSTVHQRNAHHHHHHHLIIPTPTATSPMPPSTTTLPNPAPSLPWHPGARHHPPRHRRTNPAPLTLPPPSPSPPLL